MSSPAHAVARRTTARVGTAPAPLSGPHWRCGDGEARSLGASAGPWNTRVVLEVHRITGYEITHLVDSRRRRPYPRAMLASPSRRASVVVGVVCACAMLPSARAE